MASASLADQTCRRRVRENGISFVPFALSFRFPRLPSSRRQPLWLPLCRGWRRGPGAREAVGVRLRGTRSGLRLRSPALLQGPGRRGGAAEGRGVEALAGWARPWAAVWDWGGGSSAEAPQGAASPDREGKVVASSDAPFPATQPSAAVGAKLEGALGLWPHRCPHRSCSIQIVCVKRFGPHGGNQSRAVTREAVERLPSRCGGRELVIKGDVAG